MKKTDPPLSPGQQDHHYRGKSKEIFRACLQQIDRFGSVVAGATACVFPPDSFTNKTPSKNLFVLLAKTKTRRDILISCQDKKVLLSCLPSYKFLNK